MVQLSSRDASLTTFVAEGTVTAREVVEAYEGFAAAPTPNVLWDLTRASIGAISAQDVRQLAHALATMEEAAPPRPGGRSAILCERPVDFGVARMLQTYLDVEGYGVHVVAFTDRARALDWITGRLDW